MKNYLMSATYLSVLLLSSATLAQQQSRALPEPKPSAAATNKAAASVRVDVSTTISGNQEQPRTLYVLPWQDSIAQIRIPAPGLDVPPPPIQPLDRQQFLRFIEAQSLQQQPANTVSTKNN
ncbi:hypothetical protein [Rheinheimera sp. UJ63]|uniref:hypothetical protein n=1 Tax=Rheinheimera sp. UJ63 TaxID=2910157 RepID=UPI001F2AD4B7|nr:hypothetical protein [Rheinheimera sp. UJ63]MCF4008178.1 hypothetical protein [Rheinheimera sp. UJ63]